MQYPTQRKNVWLHNKLIFQTYNPNYLKYGNIHGDIMNSAIVQCLNIRLNY